jgi:lipopolysaccharide export system protein LptA
MRWCCLGLIALLASAAHAQELPKGGVQLPQQLPGMQRAAPLYMLADQLTYDTQGNRVVAQGGIEIYCDNYILLADRVTYDQSAPTRSSPKATPSSRIPTATSRAPIASRPMTPSATPSCSHSA